MDLECIPKSIRNPCIYAIKILLNSQNIYRITSDKRWSNEKISLQQLNEFYICIDLGFSCVSIVHSSVSTHPWDEFSIFRRFCENLWHKKHKRPALVQ